MSGRDKAWLSLSGRPLVCHAIEHLAPQVDRILISANRHRWAYRRLGVDVVQDQPAWIGRGPLAAIATVAAAQRPWRLAVVPVDAPLAPRDHVARLATLLDAGAFAAAIHDSERWQPLFCLLSRDAADGARSAVARASIPSMRSWLDGIGAVWVDYADPTRFANINTPDDLENLRETA